MVKVLIKIFLPFFLGLFFAFWAFSFASAEEVSLVPSDSFELYSSLSGTSTSFIQEVKRSVSDYPFTDSSCELGTTSLVPDSFYLYSSSSSSYFSIIKTVYGSSPTFNFSFDNCVVTLDMTNNINGYYRYSFDLYFGVCGGFTQWANYNDITFDFTPSYTYSSVPLAIPDSESGMHCIVYLVGQSDYLVNDDYTPSSCFEKFGLVHIFVESTFYYDSNYGTDIVFNLEPWFDSNISSLGIDPTFFTLDRYFRFYVNNRVKSSLFGNVDPPVTPSPTVSPYPGQDTQESIQQGVSNIEGQMNQLINSLNPVVSPIPTPADFTIDETLFDELESMTLPDVSSAEDTFSSLWDIFDPIWWFLALLFSVTFVIGIFLYVLRGGFI